MFFKADNGSVLGTHRTGLQHREAGAHPHDQCAPDQERECIQDEVRLRVSSRNGHKQRQSGKAGHACQHQAAPSQSCLFIHKSFPQIITHTAVALQAALLAG